jgi:hypothetical protein
VSIGKLCLTAATCVIPPKKRIEEKAATCVIRDYTYLFTPVVRDAVAAAAARPILVRHIMRVANFSICNRNVLQFRSVIVLMRRERNGKTCTQTKQRLRRRRFSSSTSCMYHILASNSAVRCDYASR